MNRVISELTYDLNIYTRDLNICAILNLYNSNLSYRFNNAEANFSKLPNLIQCDICLS